MTDRIVGLELGADDYLPKPFEPSELMARLQANIKRQQKSANRHNLSFEDLTIDLDTQQVTVDQAALDLTPCR